MAFDLPAVARRRIASADRDRDRRLLEAHPLGLHRDASERSLEVALDVDRERLQRGHIEDATALRFCRNRLRRQPVDAPEEGGERLATSGGRRHQGVLARGDRPPAAVLDLGWGREGAREPGSRRRAKTGPDRWASTSVYCPG